MRDLTVQDIIDMQKMPQEMQEPSAVARAMSKTIDEVLAMPAKEYMKCRQRVLKANGLA